MNQATLDRILRKRFETRSLLNQDNPTILDAKCFIHDGHACHSVKLLVVKGYYAIGDTIEPRCTTTDKYLYDVVIVKIDDSYLAYKDRFGLIKKKSLLNSKTLDWIRKDPMIFTEFSRSDMTVDEFEVKKRGLIKSIQFGF